jgi:hypothetical protein
MAYLAWDEIANNLRDLIQFIIGNIKASDKQSPLADLVESSVDEKKMKWKRNVNDGDGDWLEIDHLIIGDVYHWKWWSLYIWYVIE